MKSVLPVAGIATITLAAVIGHAPDPIQGRELFLANCAACHGSWAEGDGPATAALGINAPDLTVVRARVSPMLWPLAGIMPWRKAMRESSNAKLSAAEAIRTIEPLNRPRKNLMSASSAEVTAGRRDVREHGPRVMPVWGEEFEIAAGGGARAEGIAWERIEALVAYLETVQEGYEAE